MAEHEYGPETRVGLVGLGATGVPVALRLAAAGHEVVAWNLEPERFALVRRAGVAWAASPAAVRAASDVVFLCVRGDEAVESCCTGPHGFASAGGARMLVDLSTTSPAMTGAMARRMAAAGMAWVDAPLRGGPEAAREGQLALLLGGAEAHCVAVLPLLRVIAGRITRMGSPGAGQATALLEQAAEGMTTVLMAELLALCRAAGVDPELLPQALSGGVADGPALQNMLPRMAAGAFTPPVQPARVLDANLGAALALATGLELDLPLLRAAAERCHAFAVRAPETDAAAVAQTYCAT